MLSTTAAHQVRVSRLPAPRGPLSTAVLDILGGRTTAAAPNIGPGTVEQADPYGEDVQLALYCCYELHYRGFAGVAEDLEWDPGLLAVRRLRGALIGQFATVELTSSPGSDREPELAADVVFGIHASTLLADRLSRLLLREWTRNRPTLRHPLPDAPRS